MIKRKAITHRCFFFRFLVFLFCWFLWVLSLAYLNLFGTKRLCCCCCCPTGTVKVVLPDNCYCMLY
uniref:Uncharacterized protein n=1 Tax=Arundo donax TaxID=35708 RepID=A0A0A9CU83_ARUDO